MKKAIVLFEITNFKTIVTITTDGTDTLDITGTDIEKKFIRFLKALKKYNTEKFIMDSIDINSWQEVKTTNNGTK